MNKEDKLKLYDHVIRLGSIEHQDYKLKEELFEQGTELIRVQTGRNKANSKDIIEEHADCIIMLEQYARNHFKEDLIDYKLKEEVQFDNIVFYSTVVIQNIIKKFEYKPNIDILYSYMLSHISKLGIMPLVEIVKDCKLKRLLERVRCGGILEKQ